MGLSRNWAWAGGHCDHVGGGTGRGCHLLCADCQGAAFTLLCGWTFCPRFFPELALGREPLPVTWRVPRIV